MTIRGLTVPFCALAIYFSAVAGAKQMPFERGADFGLRPLPNQGTCSVLMSSMAPPTPATTPSQLRAQKLLGEIASGEILNFKLLEEEVLDLIRLRPLWMGHTDERRILAHMIETTPLNLLGRVFTWAVRGSREAARSELIHAFRARLRSLDPKEMHSNWWDTYIYLQLLADVPTDRLMPVLEAETFPIWLKDILFDRPLRITGPSIRTFYSDGHYCGTCRYMFTTHMEALDLAMNPPGQKFTHSVLIVYSGHLIGSVKIGYATDPSFLALRNVHDSDGRAVLIEGGVYSLRKSLVERITAAAKDLTFTVRLAVDELEVRPESFILNQIAFSNASSDLNLVLSPEGLRAHPS